MQVKSVTPILNVSSIQKSFAWFEKLGWSKAWEWGDPPGFGSVGFGEFEIYMCQDGQGSRGKGSSSLTFGPTGDQNGDKGVWMVWAVDDVDAIHAHCLAQGLEVTWPPTNMPWHMREMHVRHPDGHIFRIGKGIG